MKKYTLLELMVAMLIFVIMMGILSSTFGAASTITASESLKNNLAIDANTFFDYLSADLRKATVDAFESPELEIGHDSADFSLFRERDPENNKPTTDDSNSQNRSMKLTYTDSDEDSELSFYSNTTPYTHTSLKNKLDDTTNNDYRLLPYISYIYDSSAKTISRQMDAVNPVTDASLFVSNTPPSGIILEGVLEFGIEIWEDSPGGAPAGTGIINETPACITFWVKLESANPYMNSSDKENNVRTFTKTIFLK